MADLHSTEFLTLLRKSGLLTPQQLDAAQDIMTTLRASGTSSNADGVTSARLAEEFVRGNLVTQWQANQLLKGQTGFILQKYRLLAPVGRGGMGHVFKALDTSSGGIVAIKVMSRKLTGNQTLVNRFRREIRASSLLNDTHIVRTLDAGRVGKVDFMVMEYVNGDQVDRIVSRVTLIPVAMACDIVRQAALGLQHAHEQKMVHRDLKPGNLIVDWSADGKGTVKIMDMGLVRLGSDGDERTSVTRAGQVMGTPDYMSPEQGWDTATVDIRSDIYSLGCTLFRLLTGRVPFPGDNPLQVLMARCSKDAPSVRSVRADVPEPVDAIVRRMTLRDPAGRYQSPGELVAALEPFSNSLTTSGLRNALREAGDDDAIVLELADVADHGEQQDAGYQQFLREMDSGAAVDLMLSTNPGQQGQTLSPTLPVLPQVERRVAGNRRPTKTARSATSVIAMASAIAAIALIALFLMVNRSENNVDPKRPKDSGSSKPIVPVAKLMAPKPVKIMVGTSLTYQPEFEGERPANSKGQAFRFQGGKGTPVGVRINATSGLVEWAVPREQAAAEYEIPIEFLYSNSGETLVVASTTLVATVEAGAPRYSFPAREPVMIRPGEPLRLRVQATPQPPEGAKLEYRLGSGQTPEMTLEPLSGQFLWTPLPDDFGRKLLSVHLFDRESQKDIATGSLVLMVRPVFTLPAFPEQSAMAGQMFQMQLMDRAPKLLGRAFRVVVKPGAPEGVVVEPRRGLLTWDVPRDAKGRYEIRLILESQVPNLELAADEQRETLIVVNVAGLKAESLIPAESDIDAAEASLRELFKRELAAAKSSSDRALLARDLLDRSEGQSAGAEDYALLDLVTELAEKARSFDLRLDANRIRAERYAIPEVPAALELMEGFRANSVSSAQHSAVIEHCLRLALASATDENYASVVALLTPADLLLRKSEKGSLVKALADDVQKAILLAGELSTSAASELKKEELRKTLKSWQFDEFFSDVSSLLYVSSDSGVADGGRALWKFNKGRTTLSSPKRDASVGIMTPEQGLDRYLLRMQLSSNSTAAMLIFGAGPEQTLSSHLLTLDRSNFGQIATVPAGTILLKPVAGGNVPTNGWNEIEVLVDGTQVNMRLNGNPVVSTQVPTLKPGRLGFLVPLDKANMASIDLRRVRILRLPGSAEN